MIAVVVPFERPAGGRTHHRQLVRTGRRCADGRLGLYALTGSARRHRHRIFGQDVTLLGPTHLMMIGGAGSRYMRR
ncbi:hypothetical protein I552_0009 [Mycobacterium xenopi 3993]|nr:hypothetical protein I552_0009 [Mycobacterium xenopi 3993]